MKSLKEAIAEGARRRQKEEAKKQKEAEKKATRAKKQHALAVSKFKAELKKSGEIFDLIAETIAQGKTELVMGGGAALAEAIRSFPGLQASYNSGYSHINSDEVEEFWERVTVTWKKQ